MIILYAPLVVFRIRRFVPLKLEVEWIPYLFHPRIVVQGGVLFSIRLSTFWKNLARWTTGSDYPEKGADPAEHEEGYAEERNPFLFVFRARISRNNKVNGKKKKKKKRV